MVDQKYIKNIQGKDFVLFEGLLDAAHAAGLKSIVTELAQIPDENNGTCIVCARVTMADDRVFTGIGDASSGNVGKMIAPHIIRMAETRAIARALRIACNIGVTAFEELGDTHDAQDGEKQAAKNGAHQRQQGGNNAAMTDGQKKAIESILKTDEQYLTTEEVARLKQYIDPHGGFSQQAAAKAITHVQGLVKARKEEAAKASA